MNECKMSLFANPIAPQRDAAGRFVKPATLTPVAEVSVADVYRLITCDEALRLATCQVREAADLRAAKASLLPYVTPCGVFARRNCRSLLRPSGLVVVDVDHLDSREEAERMRLTLFNDPFLRPALCFLSPGGRGVKAFVPYRRQTDGHAGAGPDSANAAPDTDLAARLATESMRWAMSYVDLAYGSTDRNPADRKGVDTSGKDVVRACFLCHDPEGMMRAEQP